MSNFHLFQKAVTEQFAVMQKSTLFTSALTKDDAYDIYLKAFPNGTNEVFREKSEHDCNCCKQFIRAIGNVVAMVNGKLESIWDIDSEGVPEHYVVVAKKLAVEAKKGGIVGIFLHYEKSVGTKQTRDTDTDIMWDHFHVDLPDTVVKREYDIASFKGYAVSNHAVLKRSVTEISLDSVDTVIDLIDSGSLYKGNENLRTLNALKNAINAYEESDKSDSNLWDQSVKLGAFGGFRNTAIGKLLVDIDKGIDLESAVGSFEAMVAPSNYKRSSKIITQAMIDRATARAKELGIEKSLPRRHAVTSDLTVNNVLHANRTAKESMGVFDALTPSSTKTVAGKTTVIKIEDFIADVLPSAERIEVKMENSHKGNLMSLVAPIDPDAPGILKWDNNFSWTYNGDITDSMKENVKKAGGNTDGVLRFSIQWNDNDDNHNDLDAHCIEPTGNTIYYTKKRVVQKSSGMLDVDVMNPVGVAVENIIYTNSSSMPEGDYEFKVHNFLGTSGQNFTAEVEFNGAIHKFSFEGVLRQSQFVDVAKVNFKGGEFSLTPYLPCDSLSSNIWGLDTQRFHKVSMMMLSPNYWDDNATGNRHYFFILEGCLNPDSARGLYNEFLCAELYEDRKVFEQLGAKLKAPYSTDQCSGLGFSDTIRNEIDVKVDNRPYTIKF